MMEPKRNVTKSYFDFARHKYTPLIHMLAFKIGVNKSHSEELENQGLEELIRCMACHNGSKYFTAFLYGRLEYIFKHMRDSERRFKRILTLDSTCITNMTKHNYDVDAGMMAKECMEYLNYDECNVITKFFFRNQTTREISDDLGMVVPTVCRIKRMAIEKMRVRYSV